MLTLEQARELLLDGVVPVDTETVAIGECAGRVLASDVHAARNQPSATVSAMDGYAVRALDAGAAACLRIVGEAPAGRPFAGTVGEGEAVRIATGAVVPAGADSIVIQEHVEREGFSIRVVKAPAEGEFIRPAAMDFAVGQRIAAAGECLSPARLGLVAAANLAFLKVRRKPRVAIFPSGDELREPGSEVTVSETINSAAYAIAALVEVWGAEACRHPILPDDRETSQAALAAAVGTADVIVTIGGASVGDRDVLRPAAARLGAAAIFDRIAVQPGKPTWHARLPDGPLLLGLAGNPASAFVCAHLLLKPLLFHMCGREPTLAVRFMRAILQTQLPATGAREIYVRASAEIGADSRLRVTPMVRLDSSLVTATAAANALIRRPAGAGVAAGGERVEMLCVDSPAIASWS